MFYLDGLFVSQSNGVALDPPLVLCYWGGWVHTVGPGPPPPPPLLLWGLGEKECGCEKKKVHIWGYSRRGQWISVITGEPRVIVSHTHTDTHTTIHTFPAICLLLLSHTHSPRPNTSDTMHIKTDAPGFPWQEQTALKVEIGKNSSQCLLILTDKSINICFF